MHISITYMSVDYSGQLHVHVCNVIIYLCAFAAFSAAGSTKIGISLWIPIRAAIATSFIMC